MKTEDLIEALVLDASRPRYSLAQRVLGAAVIGGLVAGVLFLIVLGVRPDIRNAFETWRFVFKFALVLACMHALGGHALNWPAQRALDGSCSMDCIWSGTFGGCRTLRAGGYPSGQWSERAIGNYAGTCLLAIPLLSIVPLMALLVALRAGAPRVPASAVQSPVCWPGLSAALYATHCPDDSPLFVALWYTLAVTLVVATGALAGHRVLRW